MIPSRSNSSSTRDSVAAETSADAASSLTPNGGAESTIALTARAAPRPRRDLNSSSWGHGSRSAPDVETKSPGSDTSIRTLPVMSMYPTPRPTSISRERGDR